MKNTLPIEEKALPGIRRDVSVFDMHEWKRKVVGHTKKKGLVEDNCGYTKDTHNLIFSSR